MTLKKSEIYSSLTSAAIPRCQATSRPANRSAQPSTKPPPPWCAHIRTLRTNWRRRLQRGGNQTDHDRCLKLREIIRKASGETIDIKAYAADMRHLIDTYIEAGAPRKISPFDDMTLLELIVKSGIAATYGA